MKKPYEEPPIWDEEYRGLSCTMLIDDGCTYIETIPFDDDGNKLPSYSRIYSMGLANELFFEKYKRCLYTEDDWGKAFRLIIRDFYYSLNGNKEIWSSLKINATRKKPSK